MSDHSDNQRKREERRRQLAQVRRILAEAKTAHTLSDRESHEAQLDLDLTDHGEALEQLAHDDPIGLVFR